MSTLPPVLPYSPEAERSLLGAIFLRPTVSQEIFPRVIETHFYLPPHQMIYRHMLLLHEAGKAIDIGIVIDSIRSAGDLDQAGGPGYISQLPDQLPQLTNVKHYVGILLDKFRLRKLAEFGEQFTTTALRGSDPADKMLEDGISSLLGLQNGSDHIVRCKSFSETAKAMVDSLISARDSPQKSARMRFGLSKLDDVTSGLRRKELCVIVAPTSNGKSLLAMQLAVQSSADGFKSLYFTAEMPGEQLTQRELAFRAGIPFHRTQRPETLTVQDIAALHEAVNDAVSIDIVDSDITPARVWFMSEAKKRTKGLDLVIIDYDQLIIEAGMDAKSDDDIFRHQRSFVLKAKRLAERLDVCVVMLCQLRKVSSSTDKGASPKLDDLWGDSSIRNTPHLILFLVREYFKHGMDTDYERDATAYVLKNRNGLTGRVELNFDPQSLRFEDKQLEPPPARTKL